MTSLDTVKAGFPFTDVSASVPNRKQMQIAYQCGIINGTSPSAFSPNSLITRQDAATMLSRFSDQRAVSGYAAVNFEKALALNFFGGYPNGILLPLTSITNEQTAIIIWELKLRAEKPGLQWE